MQKENHFYVVQESTAHYHGPYSSYDCANNAKAFLSALYDADDFYVEEMQHAQVHLNSNST